MQCSAVSPKAVSFFRTSSAFYGLFFPPRSEVGQCLPFCPPFPIALPQEFSHLPFVISLSAFDGCLTLERYSQQALVCNCRLLLDVNLWLASGKAVGPGGGRQALRPLSEAMGP